MEVDIVGAKILLLSFLVQLNQQVKAAHHCYYRPLN